MHTRKIDNYRTIAKTVIKNHLISNNKNDLILSLDKITTFEDLYKFIIKNDLHNHFVDDLLVETRNPSLKVIELNEDTANNYLTIFQNLKTILEFNNAVINHNKEIFNDKLKIVYQEIKLHLRTLSKSKIDSNNPKHAAILMAADSSARNLIGKAFTSEVLVYSETTKKDHNKIKLFIKIVELNESKKFTGKTINKLYTILNELKPQESISIIYENDQFKLLLSPSMQDEIPCNELRVANNNNHVNAALLIRFFEKLESTNKHKRLCLGKKIGDTKFAEEVEKLGGLPKNITHLILNEVSLPENFSLTQLTNLESLELVGVYYINTLLGTVKSNKLTILVIKECGHDKGSEALSINEEYIKIHFPLLQELSIKNNKTSQSISLRLPEIYLNISNNQSRSSSFMVNTSLNGLNSNVQNKILDEENLGGDVKQNKAKDVKKTNPMNQIPKDLIEIELKGVSITAYTNEPSGKITMLYPFGLGFGIPVPSANITDVTEEQESNIDKTL